MAPQPQPKFVPTDELDRWLEGEIHEVRRQASEAVRLLRADQKWYQRGCLQAFKQSPWREEPQRLLSSRSVMTLVSF
jgi:hypothetical protein